MKKPYRVFSDGLLKKLEKAFPWAPSIRTYRIQRNRARTTARLVDTVVRTKPAGHIGKCTFLETTLEVKEAPTCQD